MIVQPSAEAIALAVKLLKAALAGETENFIAAVTPGGIEAQEKRGQIEQSFADTLPLDGTEPDSDSRKKFESYGFVFGDAVDRLFRKVAFPKGWRKKPTDHDMWTDIVDEQERKRGAIFYKAAFYDMRAHCHMDEEQP